MELAAQQILRAIRAHRSQRAFARRLGYRGNPLTDWEHGRRFPTASETLRAAQVANLDVLSAFTRFHPTAPLVASATGFDIGGWLAQLNPNLSITELATRVGHSRSSVSRWLSGVAHPKLPEFLELVDAATGRVPDLVAELLPISQVPALRARYESSVAAKRIAFDEPWTEAVMRVLELASDPTTPDLERIRRVLGLTEEHAARCLSLLEQAELVRRTGDHFEGIRELTVDTRGGSQALVATKAHWARVTARARPSARAE
jgi:transcriptional regulator with XRE-family HTH domain